MTHKEAYELQNLIRKEPLDLFAIYCLIMPVTGAKWTVDANRKESGQKVSFKSKQNWINYQDQHNMAVGILNNVNKKPDNKIYLYDREVVDCEIDGIDTRDYPDFCDAYIASAVWNHSGKELNEDELEELNENRDLVYALVEDYLY